MTKEQFIADIQKVYDELSARQAVLNDYFKLTHAKHQEADEIVEDFLASIGLQRDEESTMAALVRIVNLREDALEQVLLKSEHNSSEVIEKKELAYEWVSRFHTKRHKEFLAWIEQNDLLTLFYRALLWGVHSVGESINRWQVSWNRHILCKINPSLLQKFEGDSKAVMEYLHEHSLFDMDNLGVISDRSYSVLDEDEHGKHRVLSYAAAFKDEVADATKRLQALIDTLLVLEDTVYEKKEEWIAYFKAIQNAFSESNVAALLARWQDVDRAWMHIDTPLQVGHPLEYYEDHFRKAVALEWDVRIINPRLQKNSHTRANIIGFTDALAKDIGALDVASKNMEQVAKTQLYIGQPMIYYGAEFNGLFSAQVVPNDKIVSSKYGHKIFAFSDFVLASKKAKPVMKLGLEFFGEAFIRKSRAFITHDAPAWHEVYDISTVGHEFGHILWLDDDSERAMNRSGEFKNIEEFKATTGGLMAYFYNEKSELREHIMDDLVSRAVGLMSWREVGEVLPYYCEGLIHLALLFEAGAITYDEQIEIDYSSYEALKRVYKRAYRDLAKHYISKADASVYLEDYAMKEAGVYLPKDEKVRAFVEHYYARYKAIGQQSVHIEDI